MLKYSIPVLMLGSLLYADTPHTFGQTAELKAFFGYKAYDSKTCKAQTNQENNNDYNKHGSQCLKQVYRPGKNEYNACNKKELTFPAKDNNTYNTSTCSDSYYQPVNKSNIYIDGKKLEAYKVIKNKDEVSINNDENIYFEMTPLADSNQAARMNRHGINGNIVNFTYSGFKPIAYNFNNSGYPGDSVANNRAGKNYRVWGNNEPDRMRFKLINNYKDFVSVKAYVKDGDTNYKTSQKIHYTTNESEVNKDSNYGFTYLNQDIETIAKNRNELDTIKYAPELITNTIDLYKTDNSTATFAINTVKKCKQDILYEIEVKRIQINGANKNFTIFDSYPAAPKSKCKNNPKFYEYFEDGKTCTGDTNWDLVSSPVSSASATRDHVHSPSKQFIFYAIQKGADDGIDCLGEQTGDITSAFVNKINEMNDKIDFDMPLNATGIYTYINNEDAFLKIDFNNAKNIYKSSSNPFTIKNDSLISLDIGGKDDFVYYIQYDCTGFNQATCKYKKMTKQTELNKLNDGYLTYKDLCSLLNEEGKAQCNAGEPSRQNEIFFKFNNALLKLPKINSADYDKNRRDFKIKFYSSMGKIGDDGVEIKHMPLTVRPNSFEAKQNNCDIFSANNCDLNINVKSDELLDKRPLYISEYKLRVNFAGGYEFDLPVNNKKVDYTNPLLLHDGLNKTSAEAIIPFDVGNIGKLAFKDEHIKNYLENQGYKAEDACRDGIYENMSNANTRIDGKIACQTPMKEEISISSKGVKTSIIAKDNIDALGRLTAVISSDKNDNKFAYRLYPQLLSIANNHSIAKYYDKDIELLINMDFDDKSIDTKDFYLDLANNYTNRINQATITHQGNEIRANITQNSLNHAFKLVLDNSQAYMKANPNTTTKDLITQSVDKSYERLNTVGVNNNELSYYKLDANQSSKKIAESEENMYELPIMLTYTKTKPKFILKNISISSNNPVVNQLNNIKLGYANEGINFVYAKPIFKDVSVKNTNQAILTKDYVKLNYLNNSNVYTEFKYVANVDFNTNKCHENPCYIESNSKEIPGLNANNLSSDYNFIIENLPNNTVKVTATKDLQYIKDSIRCRGGEYNCDSVFTIEFIK